MDWKELNSHSINSCCRKSVWTTPHKFSVTVTSKWGTAYRRRPPPENGLVSSPPSGFKQFPATTTHSPTTPPLSKPSWHSLSSSSTTSPSPKTSEKRSAYSPALLPTAYLRPSSSSSAPSSDSSATAPSGSSSAAASNPSHIGP